MDESLMFRQSQYPYVEILKYFLDIVNKPHQWQTTRFVTIDHTCKARVFTKKKPHIVSPHTTICYFTIFVSPCPFIIESQCFAIIVDSLPQVFYREMRIAPYEFLCFHRFCIFGVIKQNLLTQLMKLFTVL